MNVLPPFELHTPETQSFVFVMGEVEFTGSFQSMLGSSFLKALFGAQNTAS